MITVIEYKPEHLTELDLKFREKAPKVIVTDAVTFMSRGKPLAIIGTFWPSPNVVHFWSLISKEVSKCPVSFHKTTLKLLKFYELTYRPQRLQLEVRVDYNEGARWAEGLGFHRESVMKKYAYDQTDCYLYARVL